LKIDVNLLRAQKIILEYGPFKKILFIEKLERQLQVEKEERCTLQHAAAQQDSVAFFLRLSLYVSCISLGG
jgi:hypothetical protein